jgi:uncharacterized membrane protein YphA (DoxX/SURF4 family)
MTPRRIVPRRLTLRWFATRGWAFGGAITFGIAAVWLRPPEFPIHLAWLVVGLSFAAVSLFAVGLFPECVSVRLMSIGFTVAVALIRSWALVTTAHQPWSYRLSSAIIWLWIAFASWMLATLTAKVPNRGKA